MRKVSVACSVRYYFECEIPEDTDDYATTCDSEDPVYHDICQLFMNNNIYDFDGTIDSVVDCKTTQILWED